MIDPSSSTVDPYAPPLATIAPGGSEDLHSAEAIRRELIKHEASIRALGLLYLIGGVATGIGSIFMLTGLAAMPLTGDETYDKGFAVGLAAFYVLLAVVYVYLGRGLRRLDPKARLGTTLLAIVGLIAFPVGTVIGLYILYLLHSEKGKRVMTTGYQQIVAQTPHVKYRTPLWLIILAILFLAGIAVGIFMLLQT